jgi:predicted RNA binding protein YcfA (HicA-like mRNA interferase family)
MLPKLRRLSGADVGCILGRFGFVVHSRRGSHAKLRLILPGGEKQTLTIPLHDDLDARTLRAILRQASKYIPLEELRERFYVE